MNHSVLFVCLGNICRSPTAEGVFRKLVEEAHPDNQLIIDSAGTTGYHAGEHADSRAISAAKNRGYDLSKILSRQVRESDFHEFDFIIAMDRENYRNLKHLAVQTGNECYIDKIRLFLTYSQQAAYQEVPDPYYGGAKGFDLVIDLIEDASHGLIKQLSVK
ncbi:low molecular weight phosphotyrosine protein phosphatase [Aliikangiella marina]|uniref:Low molecular weight phosphotyrosine protein phosphatase n=1 Tax=Aliikangiella marina TaxID=1712262 RepID=A0A545TJF9_9GAMM|nr:low molecular weight protein-tyrosine-phosphatase [Aliikangiella marina]TQV77306.1 low molecular weight phosphotyrosine protein phosphatase [Aliikangiella marina]